MTHVIDLRTCEHTVAMPPVLLLLLLQLSGSASFLELLVSALVLLKPDAWFHLLFKIYSALRLLSGLPPEGHLP